jgi:hypothetical protein
LPRWESKAEAVVRRAKAWVGLVITGVLAGRRVSAFVPGSAVREWGSRPEPGRTGRERPRPPAGSDPRLCAAIVDRLTFNGTIIETGTDSYRLASTRARAEEPAAG